MVDVTCLAYGLHRVAELARTIFPNMNLLISTTKKVFVKAQSRKRKFIQETNGVVPIPMWLQDVERGFKPLFITPNISILLKELLIL